MKFRSTTGEDVFMSLTTGHTAIVGVELTELDKMFHKEAIARGCLPEGVAEDQAPDTSGAFNRKEVIVNAINEMLDGGDEDDFTSTGKPDLRKLNAKVGFQVARNEADAIWEEISKKE